VNREILGPYGFYAKPGSATDFAAQLELALTNRELATERATGARARAVAELSWERAAIAIEAIYAAVIARRQQSDEETDE
jgi:glycosyltransferase involved in cell wall biosynthesis